MLQLSLGLKILKPDQTKERPEQERRRQVFGELFLNVSYIL